MAQVIYIRDRLNPFLWIIIALTPKLCRISVPSGCIDDNFITVCPVTASGKILLEGVGHVSEDTGLHNTITWLANDDPGVRIQWPGSILDMVSCSDEGQMTV